MVQPLEGDVLLQTDGDGDGDGLRLDRFLLKHLTSYTRSGIKALLRQGRVAVNGRVVRTGVPLSAGDRIVVRGAAATHHQPLPLANPQLPLSVCFENAWMLVVDKPAGLPTAPLRPEETETLANALVARYPELRGVGYRPLEPGLLHRLDTETSGLVMVARSPVSFARLKRQMDAGGIHKTYLALVHGTPPPLGTVCGAIAHDVRDRRRMCVVDPAPCGATTAGGANAAMRAAGASPRAAITRFRVLAQGHAMALIEAVIERGARHQVRVHLASVGHPLAGDALYAPASSRAEGSPGRHFLHAARLDFVDPSTGKPRQVLSPLPEPLVGWLEQVGIGRDVVAAWLRG